MGAGPKFVKLGGRVGYLDQDLDDFLERNRRSSTGSPRIDGRISMGTAGV
jgi:hypothetical protein